MVEGGWVEPSADMREFAHNLREMFVALVAEGFTETQALSVIGHTLRNFGQSEAT